MTMAPERLLYCSHTARVRSHCELHVGAISLIDSALHASGTWIDAGTSSANLGTKRTSAPSPDDIQACTFDSAQLPFPEVHIRKAADGDSACKGGLNLPDVKKILAAAGLSTSGNGDEVRARLKQILAKNAHFKEADEEKIDVAREVLRRGSRLPIGHEYTIVFSYKTTVTGRNQKKGTGANNKVTRMQTKAPASEFRADETCHMA